MNIATLLINLSLQLFDLAFSCMIVAANKHCRYAGGGSRLCQVSSKADSGTSPHFFFNLKKLKAIRHSLCTKIQFTMNYKSEMIVLHFFKKKTLQSRVVWSYPHDPLVISKYIYANQYYHFFFHTVK